MLTFNEWLSLECNCLHEASESDMFDAHPDFTSPEGGSSHDIRKLTHKTGGGTYWSKASSSDLQTVNEYLAWKLYRLYGVNVASEAHLVADGGHLRMVSSQVGGKQIPGYDDPASHLKGTDVHRGFFVDAFMGNWDVVGNEPRFNLFVDDQKRVARIDLGGFDFRAMGARKGSHWGHEVGELATMGGIGGQSLPGHSSKVFGGMKDDPQQMQEAAQVFKAVSWEQVANQMDVVALEVKKLAETHDLPHLVEETANYVEQTKSVLKSRFADLQNKLKSLGL